jgi:ribonuclease HI
MNSKYLPVSNDDIIVSLKDPDTEYVLNFDGCSKGNPGFAGAGAVIYENKKEIYAGCVFVGENETNNVAEYTGLILGLKKALQLGIRKIEVKGDSLLVIKQMKGEYKVKSPGLLHLYQQAKTLEIQFEHVEYHHVLRDQNKRADFLSNEGLNQ